MTTNNNVPHNVEAENAFLGSVIINPDIANGVDLDPNDFYIQRNKWIWKSFLQLRANGINPDIVTLQDDLDNEGCLDKLGGPAYLAGMISQSPTFINAAEYAEIIKDKSTRRNMILIASQIAKCASDEKVAIDGQLNNFIESLTSAVGGLKGSRKLSHYIPEMITEMNDRAENPVDFWGLRTGLLDLDKFLGGFHKGEAVLMAGEPKVGKSILGVQIGVNFAKVENSPGAIFTLEMMSQQVIRRMISADAKVATRKMKTGRMEGDDWTKVYQSCETVSDLPIWINDAPMLTTSQLRADLARLKIRHGIEWFLVDYLHLMGDGGHKMDEIPKTALISSRIKQISKELDLAGMIIGSVTKEGMRGGAGGIFNVRGSGQMIHDADVVIFLRRNQDHQNLRILTIEAARESERDRCMLDLIKTDNYPAFVTPVAKELDLDMVPAGSSGNGRELEWIHK